MLASEECSHGQQALAPCLAARDASSVGGQRELRQALLKPLGDTVVAAVLLQRRGHAFAGPKD